jgi:hypothetical protein
VRRRGRDGSSPLLLAGWLFADLLLALVVILLGTMTAPPISPSAGAEPSPSPSSSSGSSATPSPEPTPSPSNTEPPGIERTPEIVEVPVNTAALLANSAAERARLGREVIRRTQDFNGRQAGIVLIWGCNSDISLGVAMAERTAPVLRRSRPVMFSGAATRKLGDRGCANEVRLEIFYYRQPPEAGA